MLLMLARRASVRPYVLRVFLCVRDTSRIRPRIWIFPEGQFFRTHKALSKRKSLLKPDIPFSIKSRKHHFRIQNTKQKENKTSIKQWLLLTLHLELALPEAH